MSEISKKSNIKSEMSSILLVVFLALMIRIFVIELFFVPSTSMQGTILKNDYIFSTKYSYGFSRYTLPFSPNLFSGRIFSSQPKAGDVVIMRPPHDMETRFVKRLIGIPSDKIEIKNDITYINDIPVKRVEIGPYFDESEKEYVKYRETLPNGVSFYTYKLRYVYDDFHDHANFGPYIVPEGKFFFLGDNRDESGDSRFQLGFVPFDNFIAKAQFIIFSTEEVLYDKKLGIIDQILRVATWISSIRYDRIFKNLYSDDDWNGE